jgi:hypothetical protein
VGIRAIAEVIDLLVGFAEEFGGGGEVADVLGEIRAAIEFFF